MSSNITLSLVVEDETELRPAGHSEDPLFLAYHFKVTEQLSRTYLLRIRVAAYSDSLDLAALVGRSVTLTESRDLDDSGTARSRDFKGIVWSAQQRGQNLGLGVYYYWLDVRPALHSLAMSTRSRIYGTDQPRSIPEIIDYCLTGSYSDTNAPILPGIKGSISYTTDYEHESTYTTSDMLKSFVVQYNETDLNFMQRLMERWGIFYFFNPYGEASNGINNVTLADSNSAFKYTGNANSLSEIVTIHYVQPNQYAPGTDYKVKNFIARHSLRSKTLTLDDYNYRTASTDLSVEQDLDSSAGEGDRTVYGENFRSSGTGSDGELLAQRRGELIMSDQEYFTGQSDCFELIPGFIVALKGHFRSSYNSNTSASSIADLNGYLVTEVVHECAVPLPGQTWNDDDHGHTADFTAIECCTVYRPARVTPVPRMPGITSATIDSSEDTGRADIDAEGRYLMWAKFDASGLPNGKHSYRVRMAQPYGGAEGGGMLFPLAKDVEVLVGFVNGDPDRPVILGSAPNSTHPSPVATGNETRNRLVTDSAITLELEDGMPTTTATSTSVAAPPPRDASEKAADTPARTALDIPVPANRPMPQRPGDGGGQTDTVTNWARLYLSYGTQQSYLRLGAVPTDEATSHVSAIGGNSLPQDAGITDYTQGDRATGTLGDQTEIVGGTQTILVNTTAASGLDTPSSAGRVIQVCSGGSNEAIYGDHQIAVHPQSTSSATNTSLTEADQTIYVENGIQTFGAGTLDVDAKIGGPPTSPAQVICSSGNQYIYAEGDQYLETSGNQTFKVSGNQTGSVEGNYTLTYKGTKTKDVHGDNTTTYYGKNIQTFKKGNIDSFIGYRLLSVAGPYLNNSVMNQNFSTVNSAVAVAFFRTSGAHSSITGNRIQNQGTTIRNNGAEVTSCAAKAVIGLFSFV